MRSAAPDYYALLGLERQCTAAQIRAAYRLLVKQHHPDVSSRAGNPGSQIQDLNLAHEVLGDPNRRQAYDRDRDDEGAAARPAGKSRIERNIDHDAHLRIEGFLRGTTLQVNVNDPASENRTETYQLDVPPGTAPGTRFRLARATGGFVAVRLRALPGFRFKASGSDLRCDLRISARRAAEGGIERLTSATGGQLRIEIPRRVERGAVLRVAGEGLPKTRGGRGDLLVRVRYQPDVRVTRTASR